MENLLTVFNISHEIFQIILRYIYGGKLFPERYDCSDFFKILVAASEFDLQELVNHLQSFLIQKHTSWIIKNFSLIYQTSLENNSLLELQDYCNDLISNTPDKIFRSPNLSSIPENILISLIQNDYLKINEIQIWKRVLKWGLDQNPGLPSDPESFSGDDFNALKNTLQQCIPLIKFDSFSSKEFLDNVLPYREILPKKLFNDLIKLFLDHDHKPTDQPEPKETKEIEPEAQTFEKIETQSTSTSNIPNIKPQIFRSANITNINSRIITLEHARLISKWINGLDVNASYEFKLIFRGSRNGFTSKKFHSICDNKSHTVTIIKVRDSSEILGGYNPIDWKSGGYYTATNDSFIFSFDENQDINNHILSRVMDSDVAISNHTQRGPSFGEKDLILRGASLDNCVCSKTFYDKAIRNSSSKFSLEDYEIFQITKKIF
ncbi:carbohydrate-binding module family 13 protein [Rhizophagus irregularis DAOM 181602=DAOM 197198]|nr:carbohydrate-binding module family 13 protein [Rhizophagus irregularis DAOM 181602=DAOM 197198]